MQVLLHRLKLKQRRLQRLIFLTLAATTLWGAILGMVLPGSAPDPKNSAVNPASASKTGRTKADAGTTKTEKTIPEGRLEPTPEEMQLLARTVYGEARGEHFNGQVAVAAVVLNRIEDPHFPDDVAGVIFEPDAFTAVSDGQFWLEPDREAYRAVDTALKGTDPTCGAVYYYNPATATSPWIYTRRVIKQIGRHRFAG